MTKLCRISIVGLHFLFLTHVAHSFVLLTANVEDVKKIARKFVSDSLAEKITNFIAKATDTMTQDKKASEENKTEESSQVSAENRMYNIEKSGFFEKSEDELVPKSFDGEKEIRDKTQEVVHSTKAEYSTAQPKKAGPNPSKFKSRYIEPQKNDETTEKSKTTKQDISTTVEAKTKRNKEKTKRRFKLLSASSVEITTKKHKKPKHNPKRSMDQETQPMLEFYPYNANEKAINYGQLVNENNKYPERDVNEFNQYDNLKDKHNDKAPINYYENDNEINKNTDSETASASKSERDDYDNDIDNAIPIDEKVVTSGSLVKERDTNDNKWWEKELPTEKPHEAVAQPKGKSWF